ncbi:unnamed protein product [Pleuronectes platessa]|uniref:Uncharacterized protein n=1 Tax=Pleuronectes platessa TaxID=8262 RepID=A0A9N7UV38_PLEPL|nr:unnamed protein product [Pleuronectes platessa]
MSCGAVPKSNSSTVRMLMDPPAVGGGEDYGSSRGGSTPSFPHSLSSLPDTNTLRSGRDCHREPAAVSHDTRGETSMSLTSSTSVNILASFIRLPKRVQEAMMPLPRLDTQAHSDSLSRRRALWEMSKLRFSPRHILPLVEDATLLHLSGGVHEHFLHIAPANKSDPVFLLLLSPTPPTPLSPAVPSSAVWYRPTIQHRGRQRERAQCLAAGRPERDAHSG